jgi:hypothetical protein
MKRRMIELKEEIEKQIERIKKEENKELLEIHYLFYDGYKSRFLLHFSRRAFAPQRQSLWTFLKVDKGI